MHRKDDDEFVLQIVITLQRLLMHTPLQDAILRNSEAGLIVNHPQKQNPTIAIVVLT
jgi:hypothetical protein